MKRFFYKSVATFLTIVTSFHFQDARAQGIHLIPNPTPEGDYIGTPFLFNDKLYIQYLDNSLDYQLAQYDGIQIKVIANPDSSHFSHGVISGYYGLPVIYNNKLYFNYLDSSLTSHLGEYDGLKIALVPNLLNGQYIRYVGVGLYPSFSPTVYNDKLYIYYELDSHSTLGCFNGLTLTTVPSPSNAEYGGNPIVFGNKLFLRYSVEGAYELGSYDGSDLTLISNLDPNVYFYQYQGLPFVYNSFLYGAYTANVLSNVQIGKYDGVNTVELPNPDTGPGCNLSSPVAFNNKLYFPYTDNNGNTQLAAFDGSTINVVTIPNEGRMIDMTVPIVYDNKIYFSFVNVNGVNQLAEYDGSTITPIPNPDASTLGYVNSLFIYNNKIYSEYYNLAGFDQLVQYDGNTALLIPNPDDYQCGGQPIIYDSRLYLKYVRTSSAITSSDPILTDQLAYLEDQILPVQFVNFTAKWNSTNVLLEWQTAIEENTNYYSIQRSKDGVSFSEIAKIKAAGNSNTLRKYQYIDNGTQNLQTSKLFYRLGDTDNDGHTLLSNIVSVKHTREFVSVIYPNPTHDNINIHFENASRGVYTFDVLDLQGKILFSHDMTVSENGQSGNLQVSVRQYMSGVYFIKIRNGSNQVIFTKRVVKT